MKTQSGNRCWKFQPYAGILLALGGGISGSLKGAHCEVRTLDHSPQGSWRMHFDKRKRGRGYVRRGWTYSYFQGLIYRVSVEKKINENIA